MKKKKRFNIVIEEDCGSKTRNTTSAARMGTNSDHVTSKFYKVLECNIQTFFVLWEMDLEMGLFSM